MMVFPFYLYRLLRFFCLLILGELLLLATLPPLTHAQIILDGSLGSKGPLTGPAYAIDAKVGQLRGNNLFHSFGQFNVHTGESATFTGPSTVENVIGRVTSGQQSLIDGQIRSEMPKANLYLLNPSGVMFGPNATLDVPGSFHVSTADYLRMADGEKFSANLSSESLLTSAPPAAFGFLSGNPASITIQGSTLQVPEGKMLSVVGGDIQITGGSLSAPHGQINLASVASAGEVIPAGSEQGPDLEMEGFGRLGKVEASQGARINTDGEGGGSVVIRGGRLVVDNAIISSDTQGNTEGARMGVDAQLTEDVVITNAGRIGTTVTGAGNGGNVRLVAGSVEGSGSTTIGSTTSPDSTGNGGSTELKVKQLTLTDGARIDTSTSGNGRGGTLSVAATDSVSISGRNSQGAKSGLFSKALGKGDGGKVSVTASTLTMLDRGTIDAHTAGDGNAGSVDVQAGTLTLTGGAQIQARSGVVEFKDGFLTPSGTGGPGRGGDVTVHATKSIAIAGGDSDGNPSGLGSSTVTKGDAGKLLVSTPLLQMAGGGIGASTLGDGNGGNIDVEVGRLTLTGGALISTGVGIRKFITNPLSVIYTGGPGRSGNVSVHATEAISLFGSSALGTVTWGKGDAGRLSVSAPVLLIDGRGIVGGISANTFGEGNAGDIDIQVGKLTVQSGGQIVSAVGAGLPDGKGGFIFIGVDNSGHGGNLTVHATEAIWISGLANSGLPSGLFTLATKGSGNAGQLFVSTPLLDVRDGAFIAAGTQGQGKAGNIKLEVGWLTADGGFITSGTTGDNDAGDIEVRVGTLTLSNGGRISVSAEGVNPGLATGGPGRAGNITVMASDSISIAGRDSEGSTSGMFTDAFKGSGDGGQIFVSAPLLDMGDGGEIFAGTFPESTGNAGDIRLEVDKLTMSGDADIATLTAGPGQGGDIQVQAQQVELTNSKAAITASSFGSGNAGNIVIHADDTFRSRNSVVSTTSELAGGGKIDLSAGQIVELIDSQITTTVRGGAGDAGNITLDPRYVILNDSQVSAQAVRGNGGNIHIGADVFIASPASVVDASSQKGISGTIDIRGVVNNLSSSLAPLPQGYLSPATLVEDRCAGRLRQGQVSSFVVVGRAGMPLQPGGILPSPLYDSGRMRAQGEPGRDESQRVRRQELPRIALEGGCKR